MVAGRRCRIRYDHRGYYGGGAGALVVDHDTLLNPHDQTAAVFASVDFGNQTTLTVTGSILAGGDYVIYGGGSGSGGKVVGPVTITNNRFSRVYEPNGGYYGAAAYLNESVTTWSATCGTKRCSQSKSRTTKGPYR